MSRAWWINSQIQKVILVEIAGLADMNKYVSSICIGKVYRNGDVLYVNDDGLLKPNKYFFMVTGQPQPLSGDGIVVGPEVELGDDKWYNEDVRSSIKELGVTFMSVEEVRQWGIDNADVPASSINGVVMEYYGPLIRRAIGDE